ncbi:MAG TPA: FAD-linked oxidase C-terminal domain-containing protein [Streptosporangiaceae bacterium]|nr:FAD-linked oxidase C-terminal domain-containing protein [Streptosporangiaceae bacterium]
MSSHVDASRDPAQAAKHGQLGENGHIAAALRRAVSGEVRFDSYSRSLFSRDASMYAIEPIGVVFPRDADDVRAVVSTAAEFGVPVLPRGAGTSLAGQTVGQAIVMDLSRHMNKIVEIDRERHAARVQPGVVQDQLNQAAGRHGLMFGPDTSTKNRATLGGMIGNNSAGSQSVRYGMTIDHVLAVDIVLADASRAEFASMTAAELARRGAAATLEGAICRELPLLVDRHQAAIRTGFPLFWRQSGGYRLDRLIGQPELDLAKFVVGSEGTLVTVVEATVNLVPAPRHRVIAVGHFASVQAAIEATEDALACDPSAVELLDRTILELSRQKIQYRSLSAMLAGDPDALLFVTFVGDSAAEAIGGIDRLQARWRAHGHGYHILRAVTAAEQAAVLTVREAGLGLLMAASTGSRRPLAFVEDTAVEPARLAAYTAAFREILDAHGLQAGFYGHCSVGCLHIRPFIDLSQPGQPELMRAVAEQVRDLVLEYGGVNSSEHGDGLARSEFNRHVFGADLYAAMRETKQLFDPAGRMNPGKIVDAPAMTEHLRDAEPPTTPFRTRLTFEGTGGMRGAADRCMNIGLCRKESSGVMCPSYMATRDEEHSTRGRANALLHALSLPDPRAALGDDRLHGILDLCLECKACKSECPLGVDMAALKTEALAAYHDQHGVPLRSRLFGSIRALNRLGSAAYPVSNLLATVRPLRLAAQRWPGVSASRPLPAFARQNLRSWFRRRPRPGEVPAAAGELVFLADSFTTFTDVSAGRADIELLEWAGWRVRLEDAGCCGRSSLSKGLVDQARRMATGMTARLADAATRGVPIVAAEPSCLLTLRDEYLALLDGDPQAQSVAAATRLPEELIMAAIDSGRVVIPGPVPGGGQRILLHGHCHQKALAGMAATVAMLRAIPGAEVIELDAGCCGMAGSFGFETEHYDLSMRIGELRLFPAIREQPESTVIAATGVSCRQQIEHGTGRRASHPLEIVWSAVMASQADAGTYGNADRQRRYGPGGQVDPAQDR